jgi:hypothetical protein
MHTAPASPPTATDCLGCCSWRAPAAAGSAENTRAALHFATAAARVVMRPQLNRVASSKAVIKAMASEIQQLKAKLVGATQRSNLGSALRPDSGQEAGHCFSLTSMVGVACACADMHMCVCMCVPCRRCALSLTRQR